MHDGPAIDLFCGLTDPFSGDSFGPEKRAELGCLLECGVTPEMAAQLCGEGAAEEKSTGTKSVAGLPVRFTESAAQDLECFEGGRTDEELRGLLANLPERPAIIQNRCVGVGNNSGQGRLLREGPFSIVFKGAASVSDYVVYSIALTRFSPTTAVWRYFDQSKAEDLLKTGCLYFSRLDQLTNDVVEARLSLFGKRERLRLFEATFAGQAKEMVDDAEAILRGTRYVCCWTRREHESYLAWKHYCPSGGGFAIRSTWRRLQHLHNALTKVERDMALRHVGYLDHFREDLPTRRYGEEIFWKAKWFADEREIRFAVCRWKGGAHKEALELMRTMPHGERIACDLNRLVSDVVMNPSANPDQRRRLDEAIQRFQPALLSRISESEILSAEKHFSLQQ